MSKTILSKKAKPSQRQYEILIMRAMKMKYGEISQKLSISRGTVQKNITNLMVKLCCFSQQELVAFAKAHQWIQSSPRDNGVAYTIKPYEQIETIRIYQSSDL